MNKKFARLLSVYQGIDFDTPYTIVEYPDYKIEQTPLYAVLKEIFTLDPVTGLPCGDIAYYLSPDGNPQVKQWLVSNLLTPRARQSGTNIEGVTDDLIAEFSREKGESVSSYQERLLGIFNSAKEEYDKFVSEQKID